MTLINKNDDDDLANFKHRPSILYGQRFVRFSTFQLTIDKHFICYIDSKLLFLLSMFTPLPHYMTRSEPSEPYLYPCTLFYVFSNISDSSTDNKLISSYFVVTQNFYNYFVPTWPMSHDSTDICFFCPHLFQNSAIWIFLLLSFHRRWLLIYVHNLISFLYDYAYFIIHSLKELNHYEYLAERVLIWSGRY